MGDATVGNSRCMRSVRRARGCESRVVNPLVQPLDDSAVAVNPTVRLIDDVMRK
jgi:hypothetical protein